MVTLRSRSAGRALGAFLVCFLLLDLEAWSLRAAVGQGAQAVLKEGERLELTPEQRAQIQAVMRTAVQRHSRVARQERGQPGAPAKLEGIRKQSQQDALKVLNAEQLETWRKLATEEPEREGTAAEDEIAARSLIIPTIEEMRNPPRRGAFGPSADLTRTQSHPALGRGYVVLTDQDDPVAREALERLAKHREGEVVAVDSLADLRREPEKFASLQARLRELAPRYVAIAPKPASYRENMHLCMLNLLGGLDDDPSLDVFPGYLVASNAKSLAALVERTIKFQALTKDDLKPVSIGAIEDTDARRYRSYQKAMVMQKWFAAGGIESPALIVTTRKSHTEREDFPRLEGADRTITMLPEHERQTFARLSERAGEALNGNNLLFMFGHGTPDRICGARVSAFAGIDFTNELVFCGSCMSAAPYLADRVDLSAKVESKRFAYHAIDNGAVMVLGHMGLCGGFPKVFPMGELVLEGLSTGEAYQRLMNSLLRGGVPDYYPEPAPKRPSRRDPANGVLYVLLGDPALTPIQP